MREDSYLIGVDEAGLGPVLGPLVVAGVLINEQYIGRLRRIGVKDSKLFGGYERSRIRRELVWRKAKPLIKDFQLRIISAKEIDNAYLKGITMYDLEARAVREILCKLKWQIAKTIYLHQLGQTSRSRFFEKLQEHDSHLSSKELDSTAIYEKHADRKYVPVSMASIIAKVTRDTLVARICQNAGEKYVSGYSNLNTAIFLRRHLELHHALPQDTRRTRNWNPLWELISIEETIRKASHSV